MWYHWVLTGQASLGDTRIPALVSEPTYTQRGDEAVNAEYVPPGLSQAKQRVHRCGRNLATWQGRTVEHQVNAVCSCSASAQTAELEHALRQAIQSDSSLIREIISSK